MTAVYFIMLVAWIVELVRLRQFVLHVHFLCLTCILIKTIELALLAVYLDRQVRSQASENR